MNKASRPAGRGRRSAETRRREQERAEEWRLWRAFGLGLALIVFMLVVISVSL